jgi:hypothetical protein
MIEAAEHYDPGHSSLENEYGESLQKEWQADLDSCRSTKAILAHRDANRGSRKNVTPDWLPLPDHSCRSGIKTAVCQHGWQR